MIGARDRDIQPPVDPPDSYWGGGPDEHFCDICNDTGWLMVDGEPVHCVDCLTGLRGREA